MLISFFIRISASLDAAFSSTSSRTFMTNSSLGKVTEVQIRFRDRVSVGTFYRNLTLNNSLVNSPEELAT